MLEISGTRLRDYPWKSAYGPSDNPLEAFYIPALSRAVRYDRIAGFFSSYALAVAAQGVAKLVARGGRMRLLVGAQLSPQDVEAILRGISLQDRLSQQFLELLRDPEALADELVRRRLEVLAWLVANGRLEIRVVVEADPYTRTPVPSGGYFHAKGGIIWDESGDGIAFSGSINETATAWRYNYETFHVFCSWREEEHFHHEVETFERLWGNAEPGWVTVALPEAVRQELVKLAPTEPPCEEPALQPRETRKRWIAQFLRDAPFLVHNGWHVGVETALVEPFPHQRAVAYEVLDHFPCRRLLADEVGLGKTIEAGLILRSLLLSGMVRRCLILVPRSLAKQWQEELRDRFLVTAPFYDGSRFVYFEGSQIRYEPVPEGRSPWEVYPVVIASAQMVKRQRRAEELLAAEPWDLVIVDEAHHARRRDFLDLRRYRPNRLLALLEQLKDRTRGLLLLTATPMQVHPVEVWDLLRLLGMPEAWQKQDAFLEYFQQLGKPYEEIAWELVLPLAKEAIRSLGWDKVWEEEARRALGPVRFHRVQSVLREGSTRSALALGGEERFWLLQGLRRHTPVARLMHRHTRALLREYHQRGLVTWEVPRRRPQPVWIQMSPEEQDLYKAVEQYISTYYRRYEEVRRGLGFIMTVYRRRLTSSLYALQQSLLNHKKVLLGQWTDHPERPLGLTDEDLEEADLKEDQAEELEKELVASLPFHEEEVRELEKLLARLEQIPEEAKLKALRQDLDDALARWDQVLVFTQYTDTMDFLRRNLVTVFGTRLGCYSGRGGEVWDDSRREWVSLGKDEVQRRFEQGQIRVLLCTDAGGEGLNFQNCGVLFNYDMPWNPMKVEQRIGRVDRIGQRRGEVHIRHYFYEGTVEAEVYRALGQRINWFETVVGELQPILQAAQQAIEKAAVARPEERARVLQEGIEALERAARGEIPNPATNWRPASDPPTPQAPVTRSALQTFLRELGPEAELRVLSVGGTYGDPQFERLLRCPPPPSKPHVVRLESSGSRRLVGYYRWDGSRWHPIRTLSDLLTALEDPPALGNVPATPPWDQFRRDCNEVPAA